MSDARAAGPPDEQLIATLREGGGPEILDQLVRRHVGRVRGMILQMVLNSADADDLTQEVFLKAVRGLPKFRGDARFSTWLYRITMNVVRSFLKRKGSSASACGEQMAWVAAPESFAADARAMNGELDERIAGAMAALSPSLRAAMVLTVTHGLETQEAARIEGCSVRTMYWRIHKARKFLRKQLSDLVG